MAYDRASATYFNFPTKSDALLAKAALDSGMVDQCGEEIEYSPSVLFDAFVGASINPTFNMREARNRTYDQILAHASDISSNPISGRSHEYPATNTDILLTDVLSVTKRSGRWRKETEGRASILLDALIQASMDSSFRPEEITYKTFGELLVHVSAEQFKRIEGISSKPSPPIVSFPDFIYTELIDFLKSFAISLVMDERDSPSSYIFLANDRRMSTLRNVMDLAATVRMVHSSWTARATKLMGVVVLMLRFTPWDGFKALRSSACGSWTQHVELHGQWGTDSKVVCAILKKTTSIRTLDVSLCEEEHVDALVGAASNIPSLIRLLVFFPLCKSVIDDSVVNHFVARLSSSAGFCALQIVRVLYNGVVGNADFSVYLSQFGRMVKLRDVCFRSTSEPRHGNRMFEELVWRKSPNQTEEDKFHMDEGTLAIKPPSVDNLANCLQNLRLLRIPVFYKGAKNVQSVFDLCRGLKVVEFHWCCTLAPDIHYKYPDGTLSLIIDFDAYNAFGGKHWTGDIRPWLLHLSKFVNSDCCPASLKTLRIQCRWFADNNGRLAALKTAFKQLLPEFARDIARMDCPKKDLTLELEFVTDGCDDVYTEDEMRLDFDE